MIREISALIDWQVEQADRILDLVRDLHGESAPAGGCTVGIGVVTDDAEAETYGWGWASVQHQVVGIAASGLIAAGYEIALVPKATTPDTALAEALVDAVREG